MWHMCVGRRLITNTTPDGGIFVCAYGCVHYITCALGEPRPRSVIRPIVTIQVNTQSVQVL